MPAKHAFQRRLESIEELLHKIGSTADPSTRTAANELVQVLMELHGAGLERILEVLNSAGEPGLQILDTLGRDDLVSSLLVLYELHPLDLETRVARALEKVRARGDVELVSIQEGAVRLRLHVNGHGGTGKSFRTVVEEAVYNAAPDLIELTIEGGGAQDGFVPVEMLHASHGK